MKLRVYGIARPAPFTLNGLRAEPRYARIYDDRPTYWLLRHPCRGVIAVEFSRRAIIAAARGERAQHLRECHLPEGSAP